MVMNVIDDAMSILDKDDSDDEDEEEDSYDFTGGIPMLQEEGMMANAATNAAASILSNKQSLNRPQRFTMPTKSNSFTGRAA